MHNDMKVVQQLLMDDVHSPNDALTKDGSSVLGKYIIGAKNNFRGFNSRQEDKSPSLKVTVHNGEEGVEKVNVDLAEESDSKRDQPLEGGDEGLADCDVVKMEEGRAKAELRVKKETDSKEPEEADRNTNTDSEVKQNVVAAGFENVENKAKAEAAQDEAEKRRDEEILTGVRDGDKHTEENCEEAESLSENTEVRTVLNKFQDIELQEKKVEAKWRKGRKFEHSVTEKTDVREGNEKLETKKNIPSPTGSNSSQDTGFGSQEGDGSIDGIIVSP